MLSLPCPCVLHSLNLNRELIQHKLEVLGNTLNGEEEVLEAEEVTNKAPDGRTIDFFMEGILQKVSCRIELRLPCFRKTVIFLCRNITVYFKMLMCFNCFT